jgi:hypothetical protein
MRIDALGAELVRGYFSLYNLFKGKRPISLLARARARARARAQEASKLFQSSVDPEL